MSGGSSCSQTPSRAIPTTRRVVLADGVQLPPGDYSTTPGGTLFSTTPGGTRIIYDRKFLMECRNSPVTKTPPRDLPTIPRVTNITLPTKVRLVKAMVFPVVMYGCENWTVKKTDRRRIDAFELWCWRRLLRVPWTARRSNQSILKEINPGCSLEGLILKLKLQYFGHLM
uniref:Eukaryotic translation initiation factor 4E binding protein 1 n=1 Tax=Moschus moschiferus TaxID=68415 RepID=A0A8C6E0M3_MOSMO